MDETRLALLVELLKGPRKRVVVLVHVNPLHSGIRINQVSDLRGAKPPGPSALGAGSTINLGIRPFCRVIRDLYDEFDLLGPRLPVPQREIGEPRARAAATRNSPRHRHKLDARVLLLAKPPKTRGTEMREEGRDVGHQFLQ